MQVLSWCHCGHQSSLPQCDASIFEKESKLILFEINIPSPFPDSKFHRANMGPTWVLSTPDGPQVGPMNLAIGVEMCKHLKFHCQNLILLSITRFNLVYGIYTHNHAPVFCQAHWFTKATQHVTCDATTRQSQLWPIPFICYSPIFTDNVVTHIKSRCMIIEAKDVFTMF